MRNIREMMTQICNSASMHGLSMDFSLSVQGKTASAEWATEPSQTPQHAAPKPSSF